MAKTIEEIKDELAKEIGHNSFEEFYNCYSKNNAFKLMHKMVKHIAVRFANQKLEEAAECATTKEIQSGNMHTFGGSIPQYIRVVDKQSILNLREEV